MSKCQDQEISTDESTLVGRAAYRVGHRDCRQHLVKALVAAAATGKDPCIVVRKQWTLVILRTFL